MCSKIQVFISDGIVTDICTTTPGVPVDIIEYVDEYDIDDERVLITGDGEHVAVTEKVSESLEPVFPETLSSASAHFLNENVVHPDLVRALHADRDASSIIDGFITRLRKHGKTREEVTAFTLDLIKMAVTLIEKNKEAT